MPGHLQTLDGRPLSWAELKAKNDAYWDRHDREGNLIPPLKRPAIEELKDLMRPLTGVPATDGPSRSGCEE